MGFTTAIRTCLRKYVTFSGRASRPEYWWFVLAVFLGSLIAGLLDGLLFGFSDVEYGDDSVSYESQGPLAIIFSMATFIPILSAGWRRMHDTGRSGLYLLYPLIVMIGIVTFAGVLTGFEDIPAGNFGELFASGSALILAIAMLVFLISPLLVLWWLTRPSEPEPNAYGPPPSHIAPDPAQRTDP